MAICSHLLCQKRASFGYNRDDKKLYCKIHALEDMIDVKHIKCQHEGCQTQPNFNHPGEIKGIYCKIHALEDMINVKRKRCQHKGCQTMPTFNYPGEIKGIFCKIHALEDMINVKRKRCQYEGCQTIPNFNHPGERTMLFCAKHKKKGMVDITKNKCTQQGCKNISLYGYPGKRKETCEKHKKDEMVNLDLENKCTFGDCEKEFDFEVDGKRLCMEHAPRKYEVSLKRLCRWCDLEEESKFVCKECVLKSHKKEWSIVSQFRKEIRTPFTYDSSSMLGNCSKRRPDIFFDLPKHCVIVEVDENQHKSYKDICECARISEIVGGICGKSIILIRYNTDVVKNKGKKLEFRMKYRVNYLIKIVKKELTKEYDSFIVKMIQLFYDDDYDKYEKKKIEDITKYVSV